MTKAEFSNKIICSDTAEKGEDEKRTRDISIIIPTYNEASNIIKLVDAIRRSLPPDKFAEIVVVDDNSPDGTGLIIDQYNGDAISNHCPLKVIHRDSKSGLISAILAGARCSTGNNVLIMDADFSHPPEIIPTILKELEQNPNSVVVASRYMSGGSIVGWPYRRRLISNLAVVLARYSLRLGTVADPISGFFAFPRHLIDEVKFETNGYKFLLELLVKSRSESRVVEIPYTFINRKYGESKLGLNTILNYLDSIWTLYRHGRKSAKSKDYMKQTSQGRRRSILFLSKAGRFFTVGASGLLINYVVSYLLSSGAASDFWYVHATLIGIAISITSNFILNKVWTFEDTDFSPRRVLRQYGTYLGFTSIGALVQLSLVYLFVESYHFEYGLSLLIAVTVASVSNFIMNKKWTFRERVWG